MSQIKQHEMRRYHEIQDARILRKFSLSIHEPASAGLDVANTTRIENLRKLASGLPHDIQQAGVNGFPYLPGIDGTVN